MPTHPPHASAPDPEAAATPDPTPVAPYIPPWRLYRCPTDDLLWAAAEGPDCWFCGQPGTLDTQPKITSQNGADFERAEAERLVRPQPPHATSDAVTPSAA